MWLLVIVMVISSYGTKVRLSLRYFVVNEFSGHWDLLPMQKKVVTCRNLGTEIVASNNFECYMQWMRV